MLSAIKSFFSGGSAQSPEESKKFSILAVLFGITIGVYWLLRPLKDGVFLTMVGIDYQPMVKMLSVAVIVPLVMIYSKLVDRFPRHVLMYGFSLFYGWASFAVFNTAGNASIAYVFSQYANYF